MDLSASLSSCPAPRFRYFKTSPEIIRLAVMLDVRYPQSQRKVEDLLHGRGIHTSFETIRFWWQGRSQSKLLERTDLTA